MPAPRATVWPLEPHTRAKHEILKRYLQAWTPILTQGGFPEIMYVDGFAGPGRYSEGEEGSPAIALHVALEQRAQIRATLRFVFVEKDGQRSRVLREIVDELETPDNFQIEVYGDETFETAFRRVLDSYHGQQLPPTFAFIDPFGWSGVPFSIVQEIMRYRSCEVLVNFMYEEINRFLGHPDQKKNFDVLFGTQDWQEGVDIADPNERKRFLHDLYQRQLRDRAGAKYVRSFEMRNNRDRVDYYLFYATNNILGLSKMKDAMWKVDETGEFSFSDATDTNQLVLLGDEPNFGQLRRQLLAHFAGRTASVGDIDDFVLAETAFRRAHYKGVLKSLELDELPLVEAIDPPSGRRRGTYANRSMRLRFRSDSF